MFTRQKRAETARQRTEPLDEHTSCCILFILRYEPYDEMPTVARFQKGLRIPVLKIRALMKAVKMMRDLVICGWDDL